MHAALNSVEYESAKLATVRFHYTRILPSFPHSISAILYSSSFLLSCINPGLGSLTQNTPST
jgi:hypothetical protein